MQWAFSIIIKDLNFPDRMGFGTNMPRIFVETRRLRRKVLAEFGGLSTLRAIVVLGFLDLAGKNNPQCPDKVVETRL
mgnify:CR=1 FL=1